MRVLGRRVALAGMASLAVVFGLVSVQGVAYAAPTTWWVSPSGSGAGTGTSCSAAGFKTISGAVTAAATGDTINVCPGTYKEQVNITGKALTLNGNNGGAATIDATGLTVAHNGAAISVLGPLTAGTVIQNMTVENAQMQGIMVMGVSGASGSPSVTLRNNTLTNNDQLCQPQTTQNDCGESIDVEDVTFAVLDSNTVKGGTGGILLSDGIPVGSIGAQAFGFTTPFAGPTHDNTISNNTVTDNIWDCGITMPSHNSNAFKNGQPNTDPATGGGVFNNTVTGNTVTGNGTAGGGGAGILMAAPFPGTASYNNTVTGNSVSGNGQPGVTIHSHAPGQDVNGNKITGNTFGTNAVGERAPGVGIFSSGSSAGDSDAGDPATTAIIVYSGVAPITGTVITGNTISNNHYGVVLSNTAANTINTNTNTNVAVPVYTVPPPDSGYALIASNGAVLHYGNSPSWGDASALPLNGPVVGIARTPMAGGYWLASDTGGVFSYGDATFSGSLGGVKLTKPIVGIAPTPDGHGYWMVASDGGVFAFGDATFKGSTGGVKLAQPVVGMAPTADGGGYWLVAKDGGVFAFGDATFKGSTGGINLAQPVVGMAATSTGGGYWLVASDGGVFSFGDAKFHGSTGGVHLVQPVSGMAGTSTDGGYWLVAVDGGLFSFGNATFHGSGSGHAPSPVAGMFANGIPGQG